MKKISHGANIFELAKIYDIDPKEIVDFSSNINPLGISPRAKESLLKNLDYISTYPDPEYVDLRKSIGKYLETSTEKILLSMGATEVIGKYIEYLKPRKALLILPTYSEYRRELEKNNAEIYEYFLKEEDDFSFHTDEIISILNSNSIDVLVMCNPNNPTGSILEPREVKRILEESSSRVLLDETYIEFIAKVYSSVPLTENKNLCVVRGTSKFFASPGIRLGYGISSDDDFLEYAKNTTPLWSINIVADILGQAMFNDLEYIKNTEDHVKHEREYFLRELSQIDSIKIFPSRGNFFLVKILNDKTGGELRENLIKSHIFIRDCSNFNGLSEKFFRFCIMDTNANRRLVLKLKGEL